MSYLLENTWMMDTIARHGRDPAFVLAIVFPELIRYAQLRDRIEMLALSTLYVQYGDKYADFSVGRFQMKPSFARQIEEDCPEVFRKRLGIAGQDPVSDRRERLDRLRKPESQLCYLLCFCEIMDQRFKEYIWPHEERAFRCMPQHIILVIIKILKILQKQYRNIGTIFRLASLKENIHTRRYRSIFFRRINKH